MTLLITCLLIVSCLCFFLYAVSWPRNPAPTWRINLLGLGLFLFLLTFVIPRLAGGHG